MLLSGRRPLARSYTALASSSAHPSHHLACSSRAYSSADREDTRPDPSPARLSENLDRDPAPHQHDLQSHHSVFPSQSDLEGDRTSFSSHPSRPVSISTRSQDALRSIPSLTSTLAVPEGWSVVSGTVLSPVAAETLSKVAQDVSVSYEEETHTGRAARQPGVQLGLDDRRPGRDTDQGLSVSSPKASSSMLPQLRAPSASGPIEKQSLPAETSRTAPAHSKTDSTASWGRSLDAAVTLDVKTEMQLAAARRELEAAGERRKQMERATASWEPFDFSHQPRPSAPVRQPAMEHLPAWARPTSIQLDVSTPPERPSPGTVEPDAVIDLPPLPWAPSDGELVVAPRPGSWLNSFKPRTDESWALDATDQEFRQLESNLDHLALLHPSLIDQRSILNLLDQFLVLPRFHGEARHKILDRMLALGLEPSQTLLHTFVQALGRYRSGREYRETELGEITAQLRAAGMEEPSVGQQIQTLAAAEQGFLSAGNQIAAATVKEQLYALTPTPPRPTQLLLRLAFPTSGQYHVKHTLSNVLSFVREIAGSGQHVPDEAVSLLARKIPLDGSTLDGFLEAAAWAQEEIRQPLGPSFWDIIFERAFHETRVQDGPGSNRSRTPLPVLLELFHRLETRSEASINAGMVILRGLPDFTAEADERIATIRDVYQTLLPQMEVKLGSDLSSESSGVSLELWSDETEANRLRGLFEATLASLLAHTMPFSKAVASLVSVVLADQARLLPGPSLDRWHDLVLLPLLEPAYPLKPDQIASAFAILVDAFSDEMRPVEIYWRFLRKVAVTLRSEPVATTQAVLSVLRTRLKSGEAAFAGKTLFEMVDTLKEEIWKGGWDRTGDQARKHRSLDRDPRRAVLTILSVALEMEPRTLSAAFWNSVVEATSFHPVAQAAAWNALANSHASEIGVDAAILRLRNVADVGDAKAVVSTWTTILNQCSTTAASAPVLGAWLEALLRTQQYDRLVAEIVQASSTTERTHELLDWVYDGLLAATDARLSAHPSTTTGTTSAAHPNLASAASEALSPLEKAGSTLRIAFGERSDQLERARAATQESRHNPLPDLAPTGLSSRSTAAQTSPRIPVKGAKRQKIAGQLPESEVRDRLIRHALSARGISPEHVAHGSLVSALTQLAGCALPSGGSYLAIRSLFHPPTEGDDQIPPISATQITRLINLHLDILNVPRAPPEQDAHFVVPAPRERDLRTRSEDLGQFGFRSQTRTGQSWEKDFKHNEGKPGYGLLDFPMPDFKW